MRLIVAGAGGRMGRALVKAIAETRGVVLAGALEAHGSALTGSDAGELAGLGRNGIKVGTDAGAAMSSADGIIDFTTPAATVAYAAAAAAHGLVHIIGTTGFTPGHETAIAAAAAGGARIVKSGNMSLGVNLVAALVKRVAATLDDDFDIEILEMHHNRKTDAPSGTAIMLGDAAALGRSVAPRAMRCRRMTAPGTRATLLLPVCAAAPSWANTALFSPGPTSASRSSTRPKTA